MANSITENLNANDTISEMLLMLGQKKNRVCVIVEGVNDQKLYAPLLSDNTTIFQSYSGKKDVVTILKHFPHNKRVIAILDRDYEKKSKFNRLFYCDFSCAEMMIIAQDDCFDRTYSNFYRGTNFANGAELRLYCLRHLEMLSKMRQLNERKGKGIRFKSISMDNIYENDIMIMNSNIVNELKKCNNDESKIREIKKIFTKCSSMIPCVTLKDFLDITNGHDFLDLLFQICSKSCGTNISIKEIEANIRGTFGKTEFKRTFLYSNLNSYQIKKKISIVN